MSCRRPSGRSVFIAAVFVATLLLARAAGSVGAADDVEFTAAFRDGSLVRLRLPAGELPWRRISEDGQVLSEPLPLAEVGRLNLVKTPATEQVAHVRKLVYQLGDPDFHAREAAQQELERIGSQFRSIVEQARARSNDFEVNWRLDELLAMLEPGGAAAAANYDLLTTTMGGKEIHGDVADWRLVGKLRGADVEIDRAKLLEIYQEPPERPVSASSAVISVQRIERDEDELFPADVVRLDFERGTRGEALTQGTNISEAFLPLGVTFATSVSESYVGIQSFNVNGRSQGHCIANNEPIYTGVMTVRFCKPGNPAVPAGVRYVGFWTSFIVPNGTSLQAYDVSGRRLTEIFTVQEKRDFLAVKSNTPIAYIKISPTEADPDFAIDDLTFDPPVLLAEAGDPDRYSVLLASGERIHAESLVREGDLVKLGKLSVGIDELSLPIHELAVIVPPRSSGADGASGPETSYEQCFVRLADGSVLRGVAKDGLSLVRFPSLPVTHDQLVALWGSKTDLLEPQEADWQEATALYYDAANKPLPLGEWDLGALGVVSTTLGQARPTYAASPLFWFKKPVARPAASGVLRLTTGEEIALAPAGGVASDPSAFTLTDWSSSQVAIRHASGEYKIPIAEVSSLVLPRAAE